MQPLDAITLKALATELQSLLDNAKVSKVQHPSAHEFLITFWGGANRPEHWNLLYVHLSPEAPFCALVPTQHRQETVLHTFSKPTALCMLLRKHLQGGSLQTVRTLPGERVLNLEFENFNELGNRVRLVLSLELMGKHTNMILYDALQESMIAVAHGVSETMSSYREIAAGLPYSPPPPVTGKRAVSQLTEAQFIHLITQKPTQETLSNFLNTQLAGWGKKMLELVLSYSPLQEDPNRIYQTLLDLEQGRGLQPVICKDLEAFSLLQSQESQNWQAFKESIAPINEMVSAYFVQHLQKNRLKRGQQQLEQRLLQQEKRLQRRQSELIPMPDEEIQALQGTGDRILAAISTQEVLQKGPSSSQLTLPRYDYETEDADWTIEVDPSLSWVENAQLYYRRAKKGKARRNVYQQMAAILQNEAEHLANLQWMLSQVDSLHELQQLASEIEEASFTGKKVRASLKPSKKQTDSLKTHIGVLHIRSSEGIEILLGKSGQANEAIIGKLARPNDWWLHVHQIPGSHVLIKSSVTQSNAPPTPQTLLEAASLAVHYSAARHSLNVPVVYTQSKYVRKIPQSYPGHVSYRQEKTVFITPDPNLIQQLTTALPKNIRYR